MKLDLDISFETMVKPVQSNFLKIDLTEDEVSFVQETVAKIVEVKRREQGYIKDPIKTTERWLTGIGAEAALGKYLGVSIVDPSVGPSSKFAIGDLKKIGLNIGVKAAEYGNFPLVHANPLRCEIVLFKKPERFRYMLCGLYTPDIMVKYSSREFVKDKNVTEDKTGFYGIPFYKSFRTIDDLRKYTV